MASRPPEDAALITVVFSWHGRGRGMAPRFVGPIYPLLASHHSQRNNETAGSLRSLGVTPVHRYSRPFRHLLAFLPFPGFAGYRSDLLRLGELRGESLVILTKTGTNTILCLQVAAES